METRIKHYKSRYEELKRARKEFEPDWQSYRKYLAPLTGLFYSNPSSDKDKRRSTYPRTNLNANPQRYVRNLATSLVATLCPPDSRWFGFKVKDETDAERTWLHAAADTCMQVLQSRSVTTYLETLLHEGAVYGLSVMSEEKSYKNKIDFNSFTIGEFFLDDDFEGNENTCYHKFCLTTRQLYEWFGKDVLPERIAKELEDGKSSDYNIVQAIEPNPNYLTAYKSELNKPYVSCIWIEGISDEECVLEEKGMDDFPFIIFHWYRKVNSVYTAGIGSDIIADVKELQELEKDVKRARAKIINPPVRADPALKNAGIHVGSDEITWTNNKEGVTPLYNVNFNIDQGLQAIREKEQSLYQLTYNHLFSQIINRDKTMSATEVNKISQEELILLGGVVQNATAALAALCERTFKILLHQNELPDNMPNSLRGKLMTVSFHSLLAQSQSLSDLVLTERWLQAMSILAQLNPNATRKINVFEVADEYARRLDINMKQVVPTSEVEKQMAAEADAQAQAAQQQMQAQNAEAMGNAMKNYAQAGTLAEQLMV